MRNCHRPRLRTSRIHPAPIPRAIVLHGPPLSILYPLLTAHCPPPTAHSNPNGAIRGRLQGGFGVDSGAHWGRFSAHTKFTTPSNTTTCQLPLDPQRIFRAPPTSHWSFELQICFVIRHSNFVISSSSPFTFYSSSSFESRISPASPCALPIMFYLPRFTPA